MNIRKFISKYLPGRKTYTEKKTLELWRQESSENLAALKNLIDMNELTNKLSNYQDVNHQAAWQKIEENITEKNNIKQIWYYKTVAAIFVLLLAALFIFRYSNGIEEQYHMVYKGSSTENVSLHDQSIVTLDDNSTLEELSFRSVSLVGRAFFKITPDKSKPFTIRMTQGEVTVLGTKFSINTNQKSTEIYVTEGKVKYTFAGKEYILIAGDKIKVEKNNIYRNTVSPVTPDVWMSKSLKIENQRLKYVLESIAIYYNINVDTQVNFDNDNCRINTTFTKETINHVLKELEILVGLKYEVTNNTIIIKYYKC